MLPIRAKCILVSQSTQVDFAASGPQARFQPPASPRGQGIRPHVGIAVTRRPTGVDTS